LADPVHLHRTVCAPGVWPRPRHALAPRPSLRHSHPARPPRSSHLIPLSPGRGDTLPAPAPLGTSTWCARPLCGDGRHKQKGCTHGDRIGTGYGVRRLCRARKGVGGPCEREGSIRRGMPGLVGWVCLGLHSRSMRASPGSRSSARVAIPEVCALPLLLRPVRPPSSRWVRGRRGTSRQAAAGGWRAASERCSRYRPGS
jgi:hypothetical protein